MTTKKSNMLNTRQLLTELKKLGFAPKFEAAQNPEFEDDCIYLNNKMHVQIGQGYMMVVETDCPDGKMWFSATLTTNKEVINQIMLNKLELN